MPGATSPFATITDRLDLESALHAASLRNDLLPPRPEDKVSGEVGKRFWESLGAQLARGDYEPVRRITVSVPKPGVTSRPAALMTLNERTVYEALVATLRSRIDTYLVSPEVVFWPRATRTPKKWPDFEAAALEGDASHVVFVDVAGYYESIPHRILGQLAIEATGRRDEVNALMEFLDRSMGAQQGLPQGLPTSDTLATLYLTRVDRAMLRGGHDYLRHGDDIRIAATSYSDGQAAVADLEVAIRNLGLVLNGKKCRILKRETYEEWVSHHDQVETQRRDRIEEIRVETFLHGSKDEVWEISDRIGAPSDMVDYLIDDREALLQAVGELHGGAGPYEWLSVEEAIEFIRPELEADDEETAVAMFRDAWEHHPAGEDPWQREHFHAALRDSMTTLAAARRPEALDHCAELLDLYPDETELVCQYLSSVAAIHPEEVAQILEVTLESEEFRHAWQKGWVLRTLGRVVDHISEDAQALIDNLVDDNSAEWIERVEAVKLVAALGVLERDRLWHLWRRVPPQYQPDLVEAAISADRQGAEWAPTFLDGCRGDRVLAVVIYHHEHEEAQGDG